METQITEKERDSSFMLHHHVQEIYNIALDSMAQLVRHHPANLKVAGLIPGQGTCLGCGLHAPLLVRALAEGNQLMFFLTLMFLFLSFSLPSLLSKIK